MSSPKDVLQGVREALAKGLSPELETEESGGYYILRLSAQTDTSAVITLTTKDRSYEEVYLVKFTVEEL